MQLVKIMCTTLDKMRFHYSNDSLLNDIVTVNKYRMCY